MRQKLQTAHKLKTWPQYFQQIIEGNKTFEIREDDRSCHVGDALVLQEWDPKIDNYTGREVQATVIYIMHSDVGLGRFMLKPRMVCMGIQVAPIFSEGKPKNIAAAAKDALEWLELFERTNAIEKSIPDRQARERNEKRLSRCIEALRTFIGPVLN